MNFLSQLREWSKKNCKKTGVAAALRVMHVDQKLGLPEIGEKFGIEGKAVRFWMDAYGVETSTFEPRIMAAAKRVKRKRFKSLADYFRARWKDGFNSMAVELGVSRTTVESYYKVFTDEMEKEEANV